ncbi:MAG TPA: hypothetical protein VH988_32230 [Thermoanaerobaculia bacterium]|nr:hypothetical protein [Thermoanaerobaculia bacterium]
MTDAAAVLLRCLSLLSMVFFLYECVVSATSGPSFLVVLIPLSMLLLKAAFAVESAERNQLNLANDEQAEELWLALQRGESVEPFVLFLRPFFRVDHIPISSPEGLGPILSPLRYFRTPGFDLETLLGESFGSVGQLISLGKPQESAGAGKVLLSEEGWQEAVKILIAAARMVILVPSVRRGTLWEIDWLARSGQFTKCVFVVPPGQSDEENWRAVKSIFSYLGWGLPPRTGMGCFFTLAENGSMAYKTWIPGADCSSFMAQADALERSIGQGISAKPRPSMVQLTWPLANPDYSGNECPTSRDQKPQRHGSQRRRRRLRG